MAASTAEPGRPSWLPWSAFPFLSRFACIGGRWIRYVDEGSGPALLLVSAGQWSFMFRDVILRMRAQFRCLTLDFSGSGLSPAAVDHDHGVPANAGILEAFIEPLDLQDITMVVHDVGGPVRGRPSSRQTGTPSSLPCRSCKAASRADFAACSPGISASRAPISSSANGSSPSRVACSRMNACADSAVSS